MANAKIRVQAGKFWIEVDASDIKEAFRTLSGYMEVLGEPKCGRCGSADIRPNHRQVDKYHYYELVCNNPSCRAKLELGQVQEGDTLFPKRKLPDGQWDSEHHGWYRYQDRQNQDQSQGSSGGF